jgi:hypothetical protein
MGPVSVVCRAVRLALVLLLVVVVGAVGVSAPLPALGVSVAAGDADAGVAVVGSRVDAMAPSRAVGRLLAEPSLVSVRGSGDGVPSGTTPSGPPRVDLAQVGDYRAWVTVATAGAAGHGLAGVRAPPVRRSVS